MKKSLYLITRDVPVTGLPVAIWSYNAREAADQFAAIHAWEGRMLVTQILGARAPKENDALWMSARGTYIANTQSVEA